MEQANVSSLSAANKANLLSRLRAGSLPQRSGLLGNPINPFGPSVFSTSWSSVRDRSSTLASIRSSDGPSSPTLSHFSRDSLADTDVRTLDYLGLVDTPQQSRASLAQNDSLYGSSVGLQPAAIAELLNRNNHLSNRFRSYSVNNKDKYDDEEDELNQMGYYSGSGTPNDATALMIQEAIRQHNLEVQAFANLSRTTVSRPRARTAGVLDTPSSRAMRGFIPTNSRLDSSISAADLQEDAEYSGLAEAVHGLKLSSFGHDAAGDDHNVESPTRALWLGNIPSSTTVSSLDMIFRNFGPIESTRVLTHKNCGFVNFEKLESAVLARSKLNSKEIFPGAGPVRIGFAKVPSGTGTPGNNGVFPPPSPDQVAQSDSSPIGAGASAAAQTPSTAAADVSALELKTPQLVDISAEIIEIVKDLGATDEEQLRIAAIVEHAIKTNDYEDEIPSVPEPSHNRIHDAPRLREIRKRIDNQTCSQAEIEDVAMGMLPEIAELASDYLGNTVVQKLFEYCSEPIREAMLHEIAPHLAEIGVHKNGTWAAQKIIDVARTTGLMGMVVESLHKYGMVLFLDQFGNYVMQGCLRYGFPLNTFIFDTMLCRLWDLAQGRFGARAMRACLESHYATKDQQRMIAAAIALHSVQLATNTNGALLLTWFLDTCTFPRRRSVLAPRLVPHLVHLCTHKVAYLTVLKIINQRNEPEARDTILKALFFSANDQVLEDILRDQSCGATLIFKVLTTPFFDEQIRNEVVANVRNVLLRIKAQPQQGYKRLMDEVGLSTRNGGAASRDAHREEHNRPSSKQSNANSQTPQSGDSPMRNFYPGVNQAAFDPMSMQRTGSLDSTGFDQFQVGGMNNVGSNAFNPGPNMQLSALNAQQLQFQQAAMMASARGGSFYPPMGMNGFGAPAPSMDAFRAMSSAMNGPGMTAPPLLPQSGFGQPNFGFSPQMYPYPAMQYVNQPQQMQQVGAGRRGRVSDHTMGMEGNQPWLTSLISVE